MGKWLAILVFVGALIFALLLAPVALGLAMFGASGGGGNTQNVSYSPGTYVNPFNPGGKGNGAWQAARTDMGVDWCLSKNQPIRAIGHAQVTYSTTTSGWPGGGFIVYKLLDGDHKDDLIFVAEQIRDLAKAGTEVQAGDKIGTAVANGQCTTEWGWNSAPDNDLARAYPCYSEGMQTNSGKEMARFFIKLGAKPQDDPGPGPDFPTGPLC